MKTSIIKNILLVDDEANYRTLISKILHKLFPQTKIIQHDPIKDGPPDNSFDWERFDLLILDYNLGINETGLDWLRKYKKSASFPTTIMLTGEGNELLAVKALKSGADDYMPKSELTKQKLIKIVSSAIHQRKEAIIKEKAIAKQNEIFSKVNFYKELENKIQNNGNNSLLILIELEEYEQLSISKGLIILESIIDYIVSISYKYLCEVGENIQITRFKDESIAITMDYKKKTGSATQLAESLCDLFNSSQFKDNNEDIPFILNVGIVPSESFINDVSQTLAIGLESCKHASEEKQCSYHICESIISDESSSEELPKENIFNVKTALDENRINAKYQIIISTLEDIDNTNIEIYDINIVFVDIDGSTILESDCDSLQDDPESKRRIDQWMMKDAIARIISNKKSDTSIEQAFNVRLCGDSFDDNNLITWIKSELEANKSHQPGTLIRIIISREDLIAYQKRVKALISYLRKTFGIKFILDGVETVEELEHCLNIEKFDIVKLSSEHTNSLTKQQSEQTPLREIIEKSNEQNLQLLACEISDSAILSNAIATGIHLLKGDFIAVPFENFAQTSQFDSIEI